MANKGLGQVFTPPHIVELMLDSIGYTEGNILEKHIIEPSCGDGAFLVQIVDRYIREYRRVHNTLNGVEKDLITYIHGLEYDINAYKSCLESLNKIMDIEWDIINCDTISRFKSICDMDYVIGNPPYVRTHNLNEDIDYTIFDFNEGGMIDLYLMFYEIGLSMLSPTGKLSFITASSWYSSVAAKCFRKYINNTRSLSKVIDFGHEQLFEDYTTYASITVFGGKQDSIEFVENGESHILKYDDFNIDGDFIFADNSTIELFRNILYTDYPSVVKVRNGFATLADPIFIGSDIKEMSIPILKSSTGNMTTCLYPYDENKPLSLQYIKKIHPLAYEYLLSHKEELLDRSITNKELWYIFGRSQGLNDTYVDKIGINTIIKDVDSIKINSAPSGTGVYGGIYIVGIDIETLTSILDNNFVKYIKAFRKYKSGGYYSFGTKHLEKYINYRLTTS